jgi:hypothetical protein
LALENRIKLMRFIFLLLLLLGLASASRAGTFDLSAGVSKNQVELGESFTLTLQLSVDGNFTFAPQIEIPAMEGFQVQAGPRQGQNYSWVNGVVKTQASVQWELVALKSGTLSLGPFKASAKDAALGNVSKTAPAILIHVAKGQGFALPPTPTPEPDAQAGGQATPEAIKDIKPDLGFPWVRAGLLAAALLLILGLIAWWALKPAPPKKIEVVRDPGQVALLELEKARQILISGDEAAYYKELARVIRFYLRHRMRMPEKELTLSEAQALLGQALLKAEAARAEGTGAVERLQELLFAKAEPQAQDAETLAPALRRSILELEKNTRWSEEELLQAELDRLAESAKDGAPEAWFQGMLKIFKAYLARAEERWGREALQARLEAALGELGPAATARVGYILLSKRMRGDLDMEKLDRDLKKLSDLLEKGVKHGK